MNASLRFLLLLIGLYPRLLLAAWHPHGASIPMVQSRVAPTPYRLERRIMAPLYFGSSTGTITSFTSTTALGAQPQSQSPSGGAPRQPRRKLQKRKRRREKQEEFQETVNQEEELWETSEVRPLVSFRSKELGEDYWMDENELQRENERLARRPPDPGQIPPQKLWNEVLSPYRQNWIGIMSVIVVILATLVTKFPELLSTPTITIPDL